MRHAIRILKDEHRSISAVISGLKELARMADEATERPDFTVFRAMLRYVDEYPERLHHPKEDEHLFARLALRTGAAAALIADLMEEHNEGRRRVRELERSLLFLEDRWPVGVKEFRRLADEYAQFHWNHMRKEEEKILPLAELHLTADDWLAIDQAFAGNRDPIADLRDKDFRVLFSRIASLAPAPVGLGEPWKKTA
jgi:hemerythrin-like domain-containing protein